MQIEHLKLDQLKPYEKNARIHGKVQIDLLAKNIEHFGFTTPVLIDEDNEVIAGHGRLLAMKQLGKEEVPCVRMSGLSKKEIKALRLADNKIASMGDDDMDLIIAELKALEDVAMQNFAGYDQFDLQELFFNEQLQLLGKDKDKFHDGSEVGWEDSQNPDGIDKLVGYNLLSVWDVIEDVNTETGKYFLPLPLNVQRLLKL